MLGAVLPNNNTITEIQNAIIANAKISSNSSATFTSSSGNIDLNNNFYSIVCVTTGSNNISVYLPPASSNKSVTIIKIDTGAGKVNIIPSGKDTINKASYYTLYVQSSVAVLVANIDTWWNTNIPILTAPLPQTAAGVGQVTFVQGVVGSALNFPAGGGTYWAVSMSLAQNISGTWLCATIPPAWITALIGGSGTTFAGAQAGYQWEAEFMRIA